jgi:hypothetical protein
VKVRVVKMTPTRRVRAEVAYFDYNPMTRFFVYIPLCAGVLMQCSYLVVDVRRGTMHKVSYRSIEPDVMDGVGCLLTSGWIDDTA